MTNNSSSYASNKVNITDFHRGYLLSHLRDKNKSSSNSQQEIRKKDNANKFTIIKSMESSLHSALTDFSLDNNQPAANTHQIFPEDGVRSGVTKKNNVKWRIPIIFILLVIAFNLFVWQSNRSERIKHHIEKTKQEIRKEVLLNNELRIQLAKKTSFSEVEKVARERWGFESTVDKDKQRIIYLELPAINRNLIYE